MPARTPIQDMSTAELLEEAKRMSEHFNTLAKTELQGLAEICAETLSRQKVQEERLAAIEKEMRRMQKLQAKSLLGGPVSLN